MSVEVNKYFIIFSPHKLFPDSLSELTGNSGLIIDTISTAEALAKLVEKKVPAAIFLIQDGGKDPVDIINKLRTNVAIDTVPIFAVNNLQDACKRMLGLV